MTAILHFFVSNEQTEKTGVETVTRHKDIYTLHMNDGSTISAPLKDIDIKDVMNVIKKVIDISKKNK